MIQFRGLIAVIAMAAAAPAFVSLAFLPLPATGHEDASGVVLERMEHMKSIREEIKVIAAMIKGQTTYDATKLAKAAGSIAEHGGQELTSLFPEGGDQKGSKALPTVWSDSGKFAELSEALETRATRLAAVADTPDAARDAFRALAGTCKSCHDDFRAD